MVCEVVWPNLDGNPPYEAIYNVFGLFGVGTYWWVHTQEYLYPILVFYTHMDIFTWDLVQKINLDILL